MKYIKVFVLLLLLVGIISVADATIVNVSEDSYTAKNYNTTNYGDSQELDIRSSYNHTYLKFNITDYVSNATLYIYPEYCSATGIIEVYFTSSEWNESTITYNNPPASTYTTWAQRIILNITSTTPQWYAIPLGTNISTPGKYSIRLDTQTGRVYKFNSSENGINIPYLNITSVPNVLPVYNNKTNDINLSFLVSEGECIQFSLLADTVNVSNYTWFVNKTNQSINSSLFNFTVPAGDGRNPSSEIWEIRACSNYTNGTNLTREWLISSLNESEAPDYIEYFTDMNCYGRTGATLDPWGRELLTYVTDKNYAANGVLSGTSTSDTTKMLMYYDMHSKYGTYTFKCRAPAGISSTVHFSIEDLDDTWFSYELRSIENHDYFEVCNGGVLAPVSNANLSSYVPIASRWITQAPSEHFWTSFNGVDSNGTVLGEQWKTITIIHTQDDWWYVYDGKNMVPGDFGHIDDLLGSLEVLELYCGSTLEMDCIEIYDNTSIFPENVSYYGLYPRWVYTAPTDLGNNVQTGAYEYSIVADGHELSLENISADINNESLMTYDPETRTATIKTNLTLVAGGELNLTNETLLFNTSTESLDINLGMHSTFRMENSTISSIGSNPIRWNLASAVSQTIYDPLNSLRSTNAIVDGVFGYYYLEKANPKYEFRGRFIIQNSTVNNTCNIFLDAANEIVLDNVIFSNHSVSDYGNYQLRTTYYGHNNLKIQSTGEKALWIVPRYDLANFSINNVSFPDPKEPISLKVIGGEWIFNSTTIENCDLSNVDITARASNKTVYFIHYWNLTEHCDFSVLNCKLNESRLYVETDKAKLETKYYADIVVKDASGTPINNAILNVSSSNAEYYSENLYKWDWYISGAYGPGQGGASDYNTTDPETGEILSQNFTYIGGNYKRWYNARPLNSISTNPDGRTSSPSENVNNSIVLTDFVLTNDTGTLSSENITYNLTVNATEYENITLTNINPSPSWYRPNPSQSKYTITAVINNSSNTHITGYAPTPEYNDFSTNDSVTYQAWTSDVPDGDISWKKNGVEVATSGLTYTDTYANDSDVITFTATDSNGNVEQEWDWNETSVPGAPVVNFTANATIGDRPLTVAFTDNSTDTPTSWAWNFGDGTANGTTKNVTHTYNTAGTFTVTLTATNANGSGVQTRTDYITVNKSTPTITWSNPSNITYGTALSGTQNNASANVAGTFVYSPVNGTVLTVGARTLNATFTPTDSTNYSSATASVTLNVTKATPTITWNNPENITNGTALSGTQLNAEASVVGNFTYDPTSGTVLSVGDNQRLNVTFTPTDTTNYTNATASVYINVITKIIPVITWNNPANITYPTALSGTQNNATANVPGTLVYNPVNGTVLSAGTRTLNVTFIPTDTTNYTNATKSVTLNIAKAVPTITWNNPSNITYGTALSGTQNNASASVAGSYVYNKTNGTILPAGTNVLGVTFTPTDSTNYSSATVSVTLNVSKVIPTITWNNPNNITYGTALSGTQNNANADMVGSYVYNPTNGTVLGAGARTLNVTFTPTDGTNYTTATKSVTLNVTKAAPVITWANPENITYPTALSGTQNNASANVAGSFVYNKTIGTVLNVGTQILGVTFTPTDSVNYTNATASVTLIVNNVAPTITWSNPENITYGTALSGTQLNANASVAGTYTYNPVSGTILTAGTRTLNVTFAPTDSTNYSSTTASVVINVTKAAPTVTWSKPSNITYPTALNGTQLNANTSVAGTFTYSPASGTILGAGNRTLNATFTPTDTTNYTNAVASTTVNVTKATPVITWNNPANITYPAALGGTQLGATANIPGTFVYNPASGTVLNAGNRTLNVTFTPTDDTNYTTATKSVYINVIQLAPAAAFSANVTSGYKPLVVAFADSSTNTPTSWSWDLNGDGEEDSTLQNPACVYSIAGTYTVSLNATNAAGSDTETKTGYIVVNSPSVVINETVNLTNASVRINDIEFDDFRVEKKVIVTNDTIACKQSNTWSNLTLLPDRQINVTVNKWNITGDYSKVWNESSAIANTVTNHRISGYPANTLLDIYRDGVGYATVKSDVNGMINWTYDGGYSEHMFEIVVSDTQLTVSNSDTVDINSSVISAELDPSGMSELYNSVTGAVNSGYTLGALIVLTLGAAGVLRFLGYI